MLSLDSLPEEDLALLGELEDLEKQAVALEAMRLRDSFWEFVKTFWAAAEPSKPLVETWHLKAIARTLEDIALERVKDQRWVFNIPPGTAKSLVITVLFPAWCWTRRPNARFLCASYGQHLSLRDNVRCRNVVRSPQYQRLFGISLVDDEDTKTKYATTLGGWRIATSVGGPGTGEHPNYLIIDDPITAMQAQSEVERTAANDWFDNTMSSRGLTRRVVVIIVMQRLHVEDLSGHLMARGQCRSVIFPMRYDVARPKTETSAEYVPDPLDPRTLPGELLCAELINEEAVARLENDLQEDAVAQLQQQPTSETGSLFKRVWFADKFLDVLPKEVYRAVRGWDTAGTQGDGDFTAGVKILEYEEGKFLVADVTTGQWGPDVVDKTIKMTAEVDGRGCAQREEKEGGASGVAMIEARKKLLAKFDYDGVIIGTNKVVRSKPFRAQCASGNVYLLRGDWNKHWLDELCTFPTGKHDDQVDATSAAFNSLMLEPKKRPVRLTW